MQRCRIRPRDLEIVANCGLGQAHGPQTDEGTQRRLYSLNQLTNQCDKLTAPAFGFTHLGSAEWSADGSRIVCDNSMGGTTTSHVVLMDANGSNRKDLGMGGMPSLSPDGREVVFSLPGMGIVCMNIDSSDRKVLVQTTGEFSGDLMGCGLSGEVATTLHS